jgi:DNA polymerase III alpha subunit
MPMLAYGTYQKSSAWKLYAKSQGLEFSLANAVSEQIQKYEMAVKHANEGDKDSINIRDYICKEYYNIYEKSADYLGIVTSWSIAPCGYLVYSGDIRKQFGLSRIKDAIVANIDGKWAEECLFLKNDWLTVKSVDLIYRVFDKIKCEIPTTKELQNMCPPTDKCWDLYKTGCTLALNQVEQAGTTQRVQKFSPTNVSELAAFIAAIRPGFKSQYKKFESRENFSFGVKVFDDLIQTEEYKQSFILYQEHLMRVLSFSGIPIGECYTVIKNIAKKRADKVYAVKEKFFNGFTQAIIKEGSSAETAKDITQKLWQVIEDSSQYSFCSAHAVAMAYDSLYAAWAKAHYPLEFYEVCLQLAEEKGDKDRMNALKAEAEDYFGIKFLPYRFGQDNRGVKSNAETNQIVNSLSAIKGFGKTVGGYLYNCSKQNYKSFVNVLQHLYSNAVKESKVRPLILIDYFQQFGNSKMLSTLLDTWELFKEGEAKLIKKDLITDGHLTEIMQKKCHSANKNGAESASYKIDNKVMEILNEYESALLAAPPKDFAIKEKFQFSLDILGYIDTVTNKEEDRRRLLIKNLIPLKDTNRDVWAYRLETKSIGTGKTARITVKNDIFDKTPIIAGDIVYAESLYKNDKGYWYLSQYIKEE